MNEVNCKEDTVKQYVELRQALGVPNEISAPVYDSIDHAYTGIITRAICMDLVNLLRSDEASTVELFHENLGFDGPNQAIECCAEWTNYLPQRFTGNTLVECLVSATKQRHYYVTRGTSPGLPPTPVK